MSTLNRTILSGLMGCLLLLWGLGMTTQARAADGDGFKVGGAVRYNLFLQNYESSVNLNDGQFTWDTWRINVSGTTDGITLDFEYRFYPTFGTNFIHHGFLGYSFTPQTSMQLGVSQVPFGILKYASHSWWFVTPYYVGLEDDYDMGVKFTHTANNVEIDAAYYYQPEPSGPAPGDVSYGIGGSGRYSYDIIPSGNQSNEERHQFNGRVTYTIDHGSLGSSTVGVSGQYGGIYNSVLQEYGSHMAFAAHLNGNYGRFNVKAEYIYFNHNAKDNNGNPVDVVQMGAYGSGTYPVAAQASMYSLGVSYGLPVDIGPITKLTFYNDYTLTQKAVASFANTQQNILGFMITAGSVYTYCDIASGVNQPWLTDSFGTGLGPGVADAGWNTRYNINIGYYF